MIIDKKNKQLNFTEKCIDSKTVYKGNFLHLKHDRVILSNNNITYREYIEHPNAVVIAPQFNNKSVLIERQFRYPFKKNIIEYPAGKINVGENSLVCAKRELKEETGYDANQWYYLNRIYPAVSYSTEIIDLYLARDLICGQQCLDKNELLNLEIIDFKQMLQWIYNGTIVDTKTIILTLLIDYFDNKKY